MAVAQSGLACIWHYTLSARKKQVGVVGVCCMC